MFKYFFYLQIALFHFLFQCDFLNAENSPVSIKNKRYSCSICAIFKNEAKFLKEWIEYHRLIGVDHFYLYNIGSIDLYEIVLRPYIENDLVTLINWPEALVSNSGEDEQLWALSTQIPAYENAVAFRAKDETTWLVVLDINEFLVCPTGKLKELLQKHNQDSGLTLSTIYFDGATHNEPTKYLVIESFALAATPPANINKSVGKVMFKPEACKGFTWPPYQCRFINPDRVITLSKAELCINHYLNRGETLKIGKKKKLWQDADYRALSEPEIEKLLDEGYEIEDQNRPISKYVTELQKKLSS